VRPGPAEIFCQVVQGKLPVPGVGWSAYIRDPEGNTVGFVHPDTNAAAGR
jgi:predicted enzyme related to lactoylglutathione lyase